MKIAFKPSQKILAVQNVWNDWNRWNDWKPKWLPSIAGSDATKRSLMPKDAKEACDGSIF
jgi:hypothetical protein